MQLSYDGHGINGPDEYRSRLATFARDLPEEQRKRYGNLFAAAPDMLAALKELQERFALYLDAEENPTPEEVAADEAARAAIASAEGPQS